jgi:RHS repeat-associated protein
VRQTTLALLLLFARLATAEPVPANGRTAAPAGKQRLIVVWKPGSGTEADIRGLGGTVETREEGRVVITVPDQAAVVEALRHNPHVQYIQRSVFAEEILNATGSAATRPVFQSDDQVAAGTTKRLTPRTDAAILWSTGAYQYDGAGNISWIGTNSVPNSDGRSHSFAYDRVGRLTSGTANGWDPVTGATQDWTQSYVYDRYGNMTSMTTISPTGTVTSPIAVSVTTNRLNTAGVTFDTAGNQTYDPGTLALMEYDSLNMMTMKYPGVYNNQDYYIYNVDDQRVGIHQNLKWTWSLRDEGGALLRQYTCNEQGTGPTLNDCLWLEDYVYRGDQLLAAERVPEQGGRRHFHLDHLGTPRLITGVSGSLISRHEYLPFGRETTPISTELNPSGYDRIDPPHFTGHERDYSSTVADSTDATDYMHARYYSQNVARFRSVDPGHDWQQEQPQSWNLYGYVRNNPLKQTDPNGKAHLVYNNDAKYLALYSAEGALIGAWPAANNVDSHSKGAKVWSEGTYPMKDTTQPNLHGGTADSVDGEYGTNGIFRAQDFKDSTGTQREEMGVHAGRENDEDKLKRSGPEHATFGCIRTTEDAMKAIVETAVIDPLKTIEVQRGVLECGNNVPFNGLLVPAYNDEK